MPQMMPLNWLTLFSFFSILLIMFNVMNYYIIFIKYSSITSTKILVWKW